MSQLDWDAFFLELAQLVSTRSKDPSTKVGCVIVRKDRTVASLGYNGLARGVEDKESRLNDRATKLAFTVHAEPNAIIAAREPLHGCTMYTWPFPPCANCAAMVIQAGIQCVVAPAPTEAQLERWGEHFCSAKDMFMEAGVHLDTSWTA